MARLYRAMLAVTLGLLVSMNSSSAWALKQQPFDQASFEAAQSAGGAVVVHVTAPWCPTCKAQHAAIEKLAANDDLKDLVVFDVDFDNQPDVWRGLKASSQSTLIAFNGKSESGRLVGATQPEAIETLFRSALAK